MALDFNNRNPQDPNGIYSLDTSAATDAWVKDDDWSQVYYSQAEARKTGANNKVRIATAVTNDGRKFNVLIGSSGQPISQVGDVAGTDDDVSRRWQQTAPKPLPPGAQRTRNVNGRVMAYNPQTGLYDIDEGPVPNDGPPGGKPFIDDGAEAGPAGRRWGWNPQTKAYDRDLGPSPAAQKPVEAKPVPTSNSEPFIVTRMPDGSLQTDKNPNYKGPEQKPGSLIQIKGADGRTYLVPVDAQGKPGKPQDSGVPGEGPSAPTTPGPSMPQIVLGASQDAARVYKQQLQEGVASGRWSQAWADARWGEFMQVANLAVSEAATRQREAESTRNAATNLATTRLTSSGTATSNALTLVNSINGLLPAGSNLGGQAFAALLGINMIQQLASGIQTVNPNARPPEITAADLNNPTALAAKREQVNQAAAAAAAPPPVRDDWRTQPSQPAPARPAAPVAPAPQMTPDAFAPTPSPSQAPIEPAPPAPGSAPAPDPVEAAPPAAPPMDESGQRVASQGTVVLRHRLTGETRVMTRPQWEQEQARAGLLGRAANALWEEVGGAAPDAGVPPLQGPMVEEQAPAPAPPPSGGAFPPLPVVPRAGSEAGGNVQKAMPNPAGEWAALAPMAPQPMQMPQPAMAGAGQMGEPVAARRARIAATPPWRLSEDDLLWSEQNGFGQEAWGVPGRVA